MSFYEVTPPTDHDHQQTPRPGSAPVRRYDVGLPRAPDGALGALRHALSARGRVRGGGRAGRAVHVPGTSNPSLHHNSACLFFCGHNSRDSAWLRFLVVLAEDDRCFQRALVPRWVGGCSASGALVYCCAGARPVAHARLVPAAARPPGRRAARACGAAAGRGAADRRRVPRRLDHARARERRLRRDGALGVCVTQGLGCFFTTME